MAAVSPSDGVHVVQYVAAMGPQKKMWLDLLPAEICARLASHVSGGEQTDDMINLAMTSKVQRKAVISALSNKLCVCTSKVNNSDTSYWKWLATEKVLGFDFRHVLGMPYDPIPLSLLQYRRELKLPTLSVTMYDTPAFLDSIRDSWICHLEVILGHSSIEDICAVLSTVWGLRSVTLICEQLDDRRCRFRRLRDPQLCELLQTCLGQLRSFHPICYCNKKRHPIWNMLPALHSVRDLVLYQSPPDGAMLARLRRMRTLRLHQVKMAGPLLTAFGHSIVEVWQPGDVRDPAHISLLKTCTRLKVLVLEVTRCAEVELSNHHKVVANLSVLGLRWNEADPLPQSRARPFYGTIRYERASSGCLWALVRSAESLEDLRLEFVQVRADTLVQILTHMGTRLTRLSLSIAGQREDPFKRLEILLDAVLKHNLRLSFWNLTEGIPRVTQQNREKHSDIASRLKFKMERLYRRSPLIEAHQVVRVVQALLKGNA